MVNSDLLEIAKQIKELKKQQEIANYLKLYELTKNSKILASVASSMGFPLTNREEEKESDNGYKSPLR